MRKEVVFSSSHQLRSQCSHIKNSHHSFHVMAVFDVWSLNMHLTMNYIIKLKIRDTIRYFVSETRTHLFLIFAKWIDCFFLVYNTFSRIYKSWILYVSEKQSPAGCKNSFFCMIYGKIKKVFANQRAVLWFCRKSVACGYQFFSLWALPSSTDVHQPHGNLGTSICRKAWHPL